MSAGRKSRRPSAARRRPNDDAAEAPWYVAGLPFECTRCGNCCRGPQEGYVWVGEEEIERLADHLELSLDAFGRRYLRRIGDRLSLVEKPVTRDCIFWDRREGCTVYEVRPVQCRTFPFWPEIVRTSSDWNEAAVSCPGIGRGPLHPREVIESGVARTPEVYVEEE